MASLFEDHLSLDAVVAFADGEMGLTAFQRAAAHLAQCQACAAEVAVQTSARQQLRAAQCPSIPTGLLDALRSIPVALPAPPRPGAGRSGGPGAAAMGAAAEEADADDSGEPGQVGLAPVADVSGPVPPHGHFGAWPRSLRGRGFRLGA